KGRFELPMRVSQCAAALMLIRSDDGRHRTAYRFENIVSAEGRVAPIDLTLQGTRTITVDVADNAGSPIERARVGIVAVNYGAYDEMRSEGFTDASGQFSVLWPENLQIGYIYALKQGAGLDYHSYVKPRRTADLRVKAPRQPEARVRL